MYRFILTLIVIPTFFFGQVGVNTLYPIGVFHVDGGGDNTSVSPTVGQEANDVVINSSGWVGIGINVPTKALDVNGSVRVRSIASASVLANFSPRIWASDTSGNLATLTAAQVVSEGGGLSLVNVTSPIAGNGTVGSPISLNDLGVTTAKLADNAVTTAKISNANVTYAKIQNVTASRLLGNPTGSAAAPSEIGLGSGLAFDGTNLVAKPIVTIPLFSPNEGYKNGDGQINYFQTGKSQGSSWFLAFRNILDPQIVNTSGNIQVKLVLWINGFSSSGNTNFRLNAINIGGTNSTLIDTSNGTGGASWQSGFGGVVLNSNWVNFNAGTSGYAQFYLDQNISGTTNVEVFNAYLIVRSQ
jgi:hypothetical protein